MPAFVFFALATQALLLAFFAARRWRPGLSAPLGALAYGTGAVGFALAIGLAATGISWTYVVGPVLYAAWSLFGAVVDLIRPIEWRRPVRLSVLLPYVALLIVALFALWIPLWYVDLAYWALFGVLYAAHTTLNIGSHFGSGGLPQGR
jgi:hypothetical protein